MFIRKRKKKKPLIPVVPLEEGNWEVTLATFKFYTIYMCYLLVFFKSHSHALKEFTI